MSKILFLIGVVCFVATECNATADEGELPEGFVACKWDRKAYDEVRSPKYEEECRLVEAEAKAKGETCSKFFQASLGIDIDICPSQGEYNKCITEKENADPFFKECGSKWDDYELTDAQAETLQKLYDQIYPYEPSDDDEYNEPEAAEAQSTETE